MTEKKKLLVADDSEYIHSLLDESFSSDEFDVIHVYDGQEALEVAEDELPDIMVLDIMMPVMDGRDVCKQLKSNPETSDIKIIMLTGKDTQPDRMLGFELGADDYIEKPCSLSYLVRRISKLLKTDHPRMAR